MREEIESARKYKDLQQYSHAGYYPSSLTLMPAMTIDKDRTPPAASRDGKSNWFGAFEAPRITARQSMIVATLVGCVAVIEALALLAMAPLKERVPYFVEVETTTGKVTASPDRQASKFMPEERHVRFFLNQWVLNFLTIDPRTREFLLPASYAFMRGDGVTKWSHFVEVEDRTIQRQLDDPSLRREPKILNISFISDGVALIRVRLKEGNTIKNKAITVFFALVPPDSDEKIFSNPIGLYITDFVINDELISN